MVTIFIFYHTAYIQFAGISIMSRNFDMACEFWLCSNTKYISMNANKLYNNVSAMEKTGENFPTNPMP